MSYKQKLENLGIILRRSNGQTKTTCPKCSASRKNKKEFCLSVDIDKGVFKCHNCDWKGNVAAYESKTNYRKLDKNLFLKDAKITDSRKYLNGRGLSDHTIDVFMLFEKVLKFPPKGENEKWQEKKCIAFPYFRGTELINVQYRSRDKDFRLEKDAELIFYNINSLSGARKAIITEGQIDAMSAFEVGFGDKRNEERLNTLINEKAEEIRKQYEEENEYNKKQKKSGHSAEELKNIDEDVIEFTPEMDSLSFLSGWGVVSVPNGASENLDFLDNCAESFFGIDEIIIATDGDEKGIMMREALITRFGAERCKYIDWDFENSGVKDFNDALTKRGADYVIELVKNAKGIPISGIHYLSDIADDMWKSYWHKTRQGSSTGFKEFDDYFVWKKGEINIFHGYAHMGKALCINTDIPTDDGFKKMKDIEVGDVLFDENGNKCKVIGATDIMYNRPCYKVIFSDGSEVIADEEHLWETETIASRTSERNNKRNNEKRVGTKNQEHKRVLKSVKTTKEISQTLQVSGRNNHFIKNCRPVNYSQRKLTIDPYILGVWLGDGTTIDAEITNPDIEVENKIREYCDANNLKIKVSYYKDRCKNIRINNGFINLLRNLKLIGDKHIPSDYLESSISDRIELLKGLMDTDGYCDPTHGHCEFTTIRKELAYQFLQLISSLGIKACVKDGDAKINGKFISKKYRISFKPSFEVFYIKRKLKNQNFSIKIKSRTIINIIPIDSVPVKCISVDSPNKLYLCTRNYIPTHNTTMANQLFISKSVIDGWKWAVFCPENYPATTYYNGLIMSFIGKEIHPKNEAYKMKPQEYEAGMNFINDHFYFIYPDELHDIETIHEKFKYLILKKGVQGVIIDPLNQLDKTQKAFQRDDQYLSDLYMNIKRFALSHQVCYNVIAHPNSPREKNPLPVPTAYDLWGGAMNFNKADNILCIHRENLQEPFTQVHIQKNKVVDTGGSLAGTHFVGRYVWKEKRFYFQDQNPIADYWAERTKRENGEYSSEFKFTEYNNDPENEIPPF